MLVGGITALAEFIISDINLKLSQILAKKLKIEWSKMFLFFFLVDIEQSYYMEDPLD